MIFAHIDIKGSEMHQKIPFPLDLLLSRYEYLLMKILGWMTDTEWIYRFGPTRVLVDRLANRVVLPLIHGETLTPAEVRHMTRQLEQSGHTLAIGLCECRHGENRIAAEKEAGVDPNYSCVMIGDWGKGHLYNFPREYRTTTAEELAEISAFWHRRGRVLNAWGCASIHGFVISYCHCLPEYCVPLRNLQKRGNRIFLPGYSFARIDTETCLGPENCPENCQPRCYFGAIGEKDGKALIDASKCTGCGQCFCYCPTGAARALPRENHSLTYCTPGLVGRTVKDAIPDA